MDNNTIATIGTLPYTGELNDYFSYIAYTIASIEARDLLIKKLNKHTKEQKKLIMFTRNVNSLLEAQMKQQRKESLLASLEYQRSRFVMLQKQLLLLKEPHNLIEKRNNYIKQLNEKWVTCKKRFEKIPFVKAYVEINNKIDTARMNINSYVKESEKIRSDIILKKTGLLNKRNKIVIEFADFMVNKRPVILKCIEEEMNVIIKIKNDKQVNKLAMYNILPSSDPAKVMNESNKIFIEDTRSQSGDEALDTFVLPKLRLMDTDSVLINFDQTINNYNTKLNKRPADTFTSKIFGRLKKIKRAEKADEVNVSKYFFTTPKQIDDDNTKKYSDKKLIRVLEDVKLDTNGTYEIVSKINPNRLQDVNVIEARESKNDYESTDPAQDNLNKDNVQITEIIEEINLTKKISQDVILPPTQFLDFTRGSQEKRVTFNNVITVEDIPNLVNDDTIIREDDDDNVAKITDSQLNLSTCSNDSYKNIKDFVFKKHNVNLSPEFTYSKNSVVPMVTDNMIVTSKFFDKSQKRHNSDSPKIQNMEFIEIVEDNHDHSKSEQIPKNPTDTNQVNASSADLQEGQKVETSFANFIQNLPCSLNISMDTTSYVDDAEFPQCIDSSLLTSPKADDGMEQNDKKDETQCSEKPNFLSGFKKSGFSLFGNTISANKPEADTQNQNNFNFNFGGEGKPKRGGFFSLFN